MTVRLALGAQTLPDADSANVVAELRGRERPDEIVVISAHLDSWDVGQGAQDDGAGVAIVMQALATLRRLGLQPRRTIRAVLFTDEEGRGSGAKAYAAAHAAELPRHVAAFETDTGAGAPLGFMTDGPQPWLGEARKAARVLAPLQAKPSSPASRGGRVEAEAGRRAVAGPDGRHRATTSTCTIRPPTRWRRSIPRTCSAASRCWPRWRSSSPTSQRAGKSKPAKARAEDSYICEPEGSRERERVRVRVLGR